MKNQAAVTLGRLGGKAGKGKAKARTTEQARAAALTRWEKKGAIDAGENGQVQDMRG
jgi:hypothetical protein